ncbi:MAG: multicopper oxidase domain-containing protein [Leptothrix sp. (in: b-proteobacteria)]
MTHSSSSNPRHHQNRERGVQGASDALRAANRINPIAAAVGLMLGSVSMAVVAGPGLVDLGGGLMSPTYYANSPSGVWANGSNTGTALRKFVDKLPVPGTAAKANNLGQYIPVAVPEKWVTPQGVVTNDDYYELAMVEFSEKVHSDLKSATLLRGYVQIATPKWLAANPGKGVPLYYPGGRDPVTGLLTPGKPIMLPDTGAQAIAVEAPHSLGPAVMATAGVAVRFKVRNLLPFGRATKDASGKVTARHGDLFLPVDKTIVGSGVAPDGVTYYTENRSSVHLHGGDSPWISDGTPYQWFAPAGEAAMITAEQAATAAAMGKPLSEFTPVSEFLRGASAKNVPDMPDPGPGAMTFYYPNRQTARQLWYHDHTVGLTRVNVYAGLAAPYMLTDAREQAMKASGALPADEIPLVIQDKTFVPDDIANQDRNWNTAAWGLPGDMWFPHVYESAGSTNVRNNGFKAAADAIDAIDPKGGNPTARWDFGPELGEVSGTPPLMTGEYGLPVVGVDGLIHSPSTTPEAFMDTPLVNGTAYPTLDVQPRAYRFRVLNATNDRFLNLGLYVAEDQSGPAQLGATEVRLMDVPPAGLPVCDIVNPASGLASSTAAGAAGAGACWPAGWPTTDNVILPKVPDPATAGPKIVQIGNETGWLPAPRHIVSTPASYAAAQDSGFGGVAGPSGALNNVGTHGLYMSPAERSDIVIDFSQHAGKTLILYNDSPAPAPGFDDRYDYSTGGADLSGAGGAESTKPGYGPNTRTIMQIKVAANGAVPALDVAKLDADVSAAYASRNEPVLAVTTDAISQLLADRTAKTLPAEVVGADASVTIQQVGVVDKAIVEEWDPNFGRLNAIFGIVTQSGPKGMAYADRPTEFMRDGETTLWRIAHTGVDTHPVHFHLVNVQIVARVNADGSVEAPDVEELGWKETVKMNPAQDTIVAFRPKKPELGGFTVPSSTRVLDPSQPLDVATGFTQIDPLTGLPASTPVVNAVADLAWEYVWHCHILGHEENDFMRVVSFIPNESAPAAPTFGTTAAAQDLPVQIVFTDNAHDEYAYTIERAEVDASGAVGAYAPVATLPAVTGPIAAVAATASTAAIPGFASQSVTWSDTSAVADKQYSYRVSAIGSRTLFDASNLSTGLEPAASAATVHVSTGIVAPAAPIASNVKARSLTLSLASVANASAYRIEQLIGGAWGAPAAPVVVAWSGSTALVSGLTPVSAYRFRAVALNNSTTSQASAQVDVTTPSELLAAVLNAPTTSVANGVAQVNLSWADKSTGETAYQVARATTVAGPYTVLTNNLPADTLSYTDTTVAAGASYVYQVTAFDGATAGTPATSTAITAATVPVAPATAPTATLVTASTLTLSFPAGANATSYKIEQSADGGATWLTSAATLTLPVAPATAVTAAVTGVLPATSYLFRVSSVNAFATSAPITSTTPVRTLASLLAPTLGVPTSTVTNPATGAASVTLNWTNTSTGQTAYKVERFTGTLAASARAGAAWTVLNAAYAAPGAAATLMSYTDTTAASGTAYVYRLTAIDTVPAAATVGVAASQAVTSAISVLAPTLNTATVAGTTVTLSWTDLSTNETSFQVFRTTPGVAYPLVATATVTRTAALGTATGGAVTFADATAVTGTTYLYKVVAVNTTGVAPNQVNSSSPASNELTVSVVLSAPTGLTAVPAAATATATPITVGFTDTSVGETGFEVYRSTDGGVTFPATPLATVARTAAQGTSVNVAVTYSDTTAVPGVSYAYQVRAVNATATAASSFATSAPVSITIAAPSGLTATPGTSAAGALTQPVTLTWVDNATNDTRYSIARLDNATGVVTALAPVARTAAQGTAIATPVSFTDATAAVGASYTYTVVAERVVGVAPAQVVYASTGNPSVSVTNTSTATASAAPSALTANAAGGVSVVLNWLDNSTNETNFTVNRSADNGLTWTLVSTLTRTAAQRNAKGATATFTDATAVVGVAYQYRVDAAIPAVGAVPASTLSSNVVSAQLSLAVPNGVAVTQVPTGLQVAWFDQSNNEAGFQIVRTDPNGVQLITTVASTAAQKTAVGGAARSWIDTTAVAGVSYSYVVRAVVYTGTVAAPVVSAQSADSAPAVSGVRTVTAPSVPTAAITTATSITVSWTDLSTNETGFIVERQITPVVNGVAGVPGGWVQLGAAGAAATVTRTAALSTAVNGAVSYVDTLVAPVVQGAYEYRVRAVNQTVVAAVGAVPASTVTNASSATVAAAALNFVAPAAPQNVVAVQPALLNLLGVAVPVLGTLNVTWTDPASNETGFSVQYSTNPAFPAGAATVTRAMAGANPGATGSTTLTGLVAGTYYVRVASTNLVGLSTYTPAAAVVVK